MLRIRLTRVGKKNSPAYRVVIADKRRAVKRKFIEIIGHYNPTLNPKEIVINKERALFWMQNGAQPSDTVNNLMCDLGILAKKDKVNKVFGKKLSKKAIKEGAGETKPETAAEATEEVPAAVEKEAAPEETTEVESAESEKEETIETPEEPTEDSSDAASA
ncbi:MAG: 30S ribosomal protein S16 [Patescibacteria group bacterium]|nr:30S ribosomal protein S16 [Patescibacteria group bacterium]